MVILLSCNLAHGYQIATNFCTWHDSIALMSCAKFCSNHYITIWMKKKNFFIICELWWGNLLWHGFLSMPASGHHWASPGISDGINVTSHDEWDYQMSSDSLLIPVSFKGDVKLNWQPSTRCQNVTNGYQHIVEVDRCNSDKSSYVHTCEIATVKLKSEQWILPKEMKTSSCISKMWLIQL